MSVPDDMPGWKTPAMGQHNPHNLDKIKPNIEELKKLLSPEDSVLDVGCFHGHLSGHLGIQNYTGMDLFEQNVETARRVSHPYKFFQGDLFDLKGKWDVIVCSRVLMHIPYYEKAVEKLRSCCNKYLVVFIPIGQDYVDVEDMGEEKLYFRSYPKERIVATGGEILKGGRYATVIYRG